MMRPSLLPWVALMAMTAFAQTRIMASGNARAKWFRSASHPATEAPIKANIPLKLSAPYTFL